MILKEIKTISEIHQLLESKTFTCEEIVCQYIGRIKEKDSDVKAFVTVREKEAIEEAKLIDAKIAKGEKLGALEGIPIAIKDNICTRGMKTTCASKMLEDFIPPYDATVIEKLKAQGAIIIGKVNMDEFAMGSSTENSSLFATKNPHDLTKVPGGSSGGSAASVGAGFVPVSLGSDTGGSIRQPASFCGTVGIKPTYGLVSRFGLIAFASSLDQIGPITNTVKDNAITLEVIQGTDKRDATSVQREITSDYVSGIEDGVKGLKIGIPKEFFEAEGLDPEVKKSVMESIEKFKELGAEVEEFSLPIVDSGLSAYYIISSAEASSNLSRFDGVRYGYRTEDFETIDDLMTNTRTEAFGDEVKRRIMLGTYVLSSGYYDAYYKKAMILKNKIKTEFNDAFEKYDLIVSPTSPVLPFGIGEKTDDPMEMYLADIYTVTINIAGVPAISLPCGFSETGLPIGLQLIGKHYDEKTLYRGAYAIEQALDIDVCSAQGKLGYTGGTK